jgi:hypothetical protein
LALPKCNDFHAVIRAVAERFFHRFGLVMKIDDDFFKAETRDVFGDVADERFAQKMESRVSCGQSLREQSRAETGG